MVSSFPFPLQSLEVDEGIESKLAKIELPCNHFGSKNKLARVPHLTPNLSSSEPGYVRLPHIAVDVRICSRGILVKIHPVQLIFKVNSELPCQVIMAVCA